MSGLMRVRSDPRAGKGICSDCAHLFVMERETGTDKMFCSKFETILVKIDRTLSDCTMYERKMRGNFMANDAWRVEHNHDGVHIQKDGIRFTNGKYQKIHYVGNNPEWVDIKEEVL